jgi:hypothetical protein
MNQPRKGKVKTDAILLAQATSRLLKAVKAKAKALSKPHLLK